MADEKKPEEKKDDKPKPSGPDLKGLDMGGLYKVWEKQWVSGKVTSEAEATIDAMIAYAKANPGGGAKSKMEDVYKYIPDGPVAIKLMIAIENCPGYMSSFFG